MINVVNATKVYENGARGIDNISFNINKGEFVFIIGTSGSGKSTIMRSILKEIDLSEGSITVGDYNLGLIKRNQLPYYRRTLGVVFQDFRLLPNKTVYENVAFAMEVLECNRREIRRTVPAVLAMVGLHKKHKCYPNQLSGGEQQRTALARAIINKPPLLLADEPTGNLDPETTWDIMNLLEDINKRGTTILISSHAKNVVDSMQKRVITINKGKIVSDIKKGGYLDETFEY
ncbi:MAG: cell division ATP-binding protein FtsE [Lachnospirales bacterium]